MPDRNYYYYAGLWVGTQLAIPEWSDFESSAPQDGTQVDIVLDSEQQPADTEQEGFRNVQTQAVALHIPATATYRINGGNLISISPAPGAGMREVRLYLLGTVWGVLLYQRDLMPLHAGVIGVAGKAVAFCGASGAGKSSMVAALARRGYSVISDDLCRCDVPAGAAPQVWPSTSRLKLWNEALGALGFSNAGLEQAHSRTEKYHFPLLAPAAPLRPVPLEAIYLLEWGETELTRLTGSMALRRLVAAASYHAETLSPTGKLAWHWEQCAALLRHLPVWEFKRPRDWAALDGAIDLLTEQW